MSKTQPIKDLEKIEQLKQYYLNKSSVRDYVLVTLGFNTALRISDILKLTWKDVFDFNEKSFRKHLYLIEEKTKKKTIIALNKVVVASLEKFRIILNNVEPDTYIIKSRQGTNRPIDRTQAFRIIRKGAKSIGIEGNISCHSMRKTFGYWAWKNGYQPAIIMSIFNHSSIEITKRYLSIDQDDKDKVFLTMCL